MLVYTTGHYRNLYNANTRFYFYSFFIRVCLWFILLSSILEAPKPDTTTSTIIIWTKGRHVQRMSRNKILYSHCTDFYNALLYTTNVDYRRFLKIAISEYLLRHALSVHPSTWNNSTHTSWRSKIFIFKDFFRKSVMKIQVSLKSDDK